MRVAGDVRPPGDKSISHRALILGALADGRSTVRRLGTAADVASTAAVLAALGAAIHQEDCAVGVIGIGGRGLSTPHGDLDCGNSGTTARLLAGVVAGAPIRARFTGDSSLSRRPMARVAEPLRAMGASVDLTPANTLPMMVQGGPVHPIDWSTRVASAQVKSAILLAGIVGGVPVRVVEPLASRDHTERLLAHLGVEITSRQEQGSNASGWSVALEPPARLRRFDVLIPGDPSSAAFFAGLAAISSGGAVGLLDVLWNPLRTGAFRVLERMGARVDVSGVREEAGEPVAGRVDVQGGALRATTIEPADVPGLVDEIPMLACVAGRAEGTTTIRGAGELRVKESDRLAALARNLGAIGIDARESADGLAITGTDAPLRGRVRTEGDHRIAMAFGMLAADPRNAIEIDDPACVAVSYPEFWETLRRITGSAGDAHRLPFAP